MPQRLPIATKIELIKRIRKGESVSNLSSEAGVSRVTLYKWLKKYDQAFSRGKKTSLSSRVVSGRKHWKSLPVKKANEIIKIALTNPQYSPQKISKIAKISPHGVWNVLKRHDLNTFGQRERYLINNSNSIVRTPDINDKVTMIRRYQDGDKISELCREFGISRTTFYKWWQRYQSAQGDQARQSLNSWRPRGAKHWRYVSSAGKQVLEIIKKEPQLTPGQISQKLPVIEGKPILGSHGIYNFLKKNELNTYALRLAYSQKHAIVPSIVPQTISDPIRQPFGSIPTISAMPPPVALTSRARLLSLLRIFFAFLTSSFVFTNAFLYWINIIAESSSVTVGIGIIFATVALTIGSFFFIYSMRYYLTLAIVLSFSRHSLSDEDELENSESKQTIRGFNLGKLVYQIFGISISRKNNIGLANPDRTQHSLSSGLVNGLRKTGGLQPSLDHIILKRKPFVSVHLPMYNEKNVAKRLIDACTGLDYRHEGKANFEVIVCDDSTDETKDIVSKIAQSHNDTHPNGPVVKILHRPTREGFKGAALQNALHHMDPRTEFISVFDADFVPYPDTLELFLKYFQVNAGTLDFINTPEGQKSNIAVVGGYQWHVLNKSENWITRGVRSEYAGSYVIERSGREILGLLKQISGSVYMIRADVLKKMGWGTSITEDFQLTLRLYEQGYKVIYTPYVQAPAECASTLKRLIRQRMRWAEGHSHNIKKMFKRLITSPHLTPLEKSELVYLAPYYLQAAFFLIGTFAWLLAETVFKAKLPFWTALWGWSLILTNFFSLPLVNGVGLFLEEAEEKDFAGLISFVIISYLLAPFQAYASIKGFIEPDEGIWFRTPKTGRVTDVFRRGRFYRWVSGILPGRVPSLASVSSSFREGLPAPAFAQLRRGKSAYAGLENLESRTLNSGKGNFSLNSKFQIPNYKYLALATANSRFNSFKVRQKHWRGLTIAILIFLTSSLSTIYRLSYNIPTAEAAPSGSVSHIQEVNSDNKDEINANIKDGQDLSWGILVLNTDKKVYSPGEKANISMAVLDETGMMACDAKLTLKIIRHETNNDHGKIIKGKRVIDTLSTDKKTIRANPECEQKEFVQNPDFEAEYKLIKTGKYDLELTAETANGIKTITRKIRVQQKVPVEIIRDTATRIYPPEAYPMHIIITPEYDFKGKVADIMPDNFKILSRFDQLQAINKAPGDIVRAGELNLPDRTHPVPDLSVNKLFWDVDWQAGKTYHLYYEYITPEKSPDYYTIGSLAIIPEMEDHDLSEINDKSQQYFYNTGYAEKSPWQLAIDSTVSYGSEAEFTTGDAERKTVAKLADNKFVVCYNDGNDSDSGQCVVGTVSGTTITFGTPAEFDDGIIGLDDHTDSIGVCQLATNKFAVVYVDRDDASNSGWTIAATVSTRTISYGTAVEFEDGETLYMDCAGINTDKFAIAYMDLDNSNTSKAVVCTTSDTTISCGAIKDLGATDHMSQGTSITKIGTDKFVVSIKDNDDNEGNSFVGTVDGTTITMGTEAVFETDVVSSGMRTASCAPDDADRFVVVYTDTNGYDGKVIAGTVSTTTITFGTELMYNGSTSHQPSCAFTDDTHFLLSFVDRGDDDYAKASFCTVNWGTRAVTCDSPTSYYEADAYENYEGRNASVTVTGYDGVARVVVTYTKESDTDDGAAKIAEIPENLWVFLMIIPIVPFLTQKKKIRDLLANLSPVFK